MAIVTLAGRLPGLVVILSQHLTRDAGPGTVLATVEAADRFLQRREANTVACGFAAGTKSGRCFLPVAPHGGAPAHGRTRPWAGAPVKLSS